VSVRRSLEAARAFYSRFCDEAHVLSLDPLVVRLDGFAAERDRAELLRRADAVDWSRSAVARDDDDQRCVSPTRTSSTAWLPADAGADLALRAAAVAELPEINAESWQLVWYRAGEEFKLHTDTQDAFNHLAPGGRLATLFVYLNDVPAGGRTLFPELGLAVAPAAGTALFFHNAKLPVLDRYNMTTDPRVAHSAEPCGDAADKFIATKWFHPWPYPDGPTSS